MIIEDMSQLLHIIANLITSPKGLMAIVMAVCSLAGLGYMFLSSLKPKRPPARSAGNRSASNKSKQAQGAKKNKRGSNITSKKESQGQQQSRAQPDSKKPVAGEKKETRSQTADRLAKGQSSSSSATTAASGSRRTAANRVVKSQKAEAADEGVWKTVSTKKKTKPSKSKGEPERSTGPAARRTSSRRIQK